MLIGEETKMRESLPLGTSSYSTMALYHGVVRSNPA